MLNLKIHIDFRIKFDIIDMSNSADTCKYFAVALLKTTKMKRIHRLFGC